ncbi:MULTISPECIES: YkgJ family cysteine cluster protein [Pantoea]|uniref:YkgJ family cysteine cluster protein n=1 Tax=Pantoea TaxID=53335 RepID=UPI00123227C4|nr:MULTISPECIES: YkgJ family cysteine cluster protein [Pantoea]KAF6663128.1 YkgJ family cysteine cluster protein [Enterobacteriaceae bacterium EKM102V]KAA5972098.1 YkgJ family cysteine cluster protein [Pantoea sp. M_6]KAA5977369.1 YkgJ family cysteine cluster protein [Pantoea sp. M_8]KAA5993564.1 YkgJ family cysteine cluster protein [Pantoea sp. M_10]KAA5999953.1 YkgJ family cysteine cluster protein [Pantoea sp. M_5]
MSDTLNPCISCGACCAHFRVSFYWAEADDAGGLVPTDLTEPLSLLMRNMRGTNDRTPRCVALQGEIGGCVSCGIYEQRPTPCREFSLSGEGGIHNEACDRARARYGLPPLFSPSLPAVTESYATAGARELPEHVQSPG